MIADDAVSRGDPLSVGNDVLGPGGPRLAMVDEPPGKFPLGKTAPSTFLGWIRDQFGGARPAPRAPVAPAKGPGVAAPRPSVTPMRPAVPQEQIPGRASVTGAGPYTPRLLGSLGKPEFADVFDALKNDKSLTREDVVKIANEFNGPVAPSTSRTKALERIFSRHRKLTDFQF